jgi:hypothetical protein
MGPLPTELGAMNALRNLYVRHPHPPRLDACAVTGWCAECGGGVGAQVSTQQHFHGPASYRARHADCADPSVRAPPSPTAPGRVHRHRAVGAE